MEKGIASVKSSFKILHEYGDIPRRIYYYNDNCIYNFYRSGISANYYKCNKKSCKARGKVEDCLFIRTNDKQHAHKNFVANVEYEQAYSQLKVFASESQDPLKPMQQKALKKLSLEASGMLSWKKIRHTLQRHRRKLMPPCKNLDTLIRLLEKNRAVIDSYGMLRDKSFYQGAVNNTLFFANMELIENLDISFSMFIDGTFGIVPFHSRQLLVIMGELAGKPRPIIFVLMTEKTFKQYRLVFNFIRNGILSQDGNVRKPKSIMMDYEKGLRNAARMVWPDAEIQGCNFHFVQALRRKCLSIEALSTKISQRPNYRYVLNLFMRLSLLPASRIKAGYRAILRFIKSSKSLEQDFQEFINYFTKTWFESYSIRDWCVSGLRHRTNNYVEGFNNLLKKSIPLQPSPWTFLDGLINIAYDSSSSFMADLSSKDPPKDRSNITPILKRALLDLKLKRINELKFLQRLSTKNNI